MALRQLPGIGLWGYWPVGTDWGAEDSPDRRLLSVLVQGAVLSRVAAVPGSPAQGDIYILTAGVDDKKIAVYDDGAWVYITPSEGWNFWVKNEDVTYYFDGVNWAALKHPYFINTFFDNPPLASEVLLDVIFGVSVSFAAAFGGSIASVVVPPAAAFVIDVQKEAGSGFASIGSISIATTGVITFTGTDNFTTGNRLRLIAPATTDAAIRGFALSMRGTR